MSNIYSIDIKLATECNKDNIATILEKGAQKGFKYYDEIGEIKETPGILDAKQVAQKIIKAYVIKPEYGPCASTTLDGGYDTNAGFWFYKLDDGCLEFHMGDFGCPKKKGYFIDFAYYIRLCLELCEDFPILELKTTMI
jgi:hypothetical protein